MRTLAHTVGKPPKKDIAVVLTDWKGRTVYLDKQTWRDHIGRLHFDELLKVETLKENFSQPFEVRENRAAGSENAIYDIKCGHKDFLVVAIKVRKLWGARVISTYYASDIADLPTGKVIWKRP